MEEREHGEEILHDNGPKITNKFILFLKNIVHPQFQVIALILTAMAVFYMSQKGLEQQIPLERYSDITPITHDDFVKWGGEPAIVKVGLQVNDFPIVKILEDEFLLEGKVWFLFDPELISLDTIKKFSFENGILEQVADPEVRIIGDELFAEFNIRLVFNTSLSHKAFPFDTHRISLNLVNMDVSPSEAIFESHKEQFVLADKMHIPEWQHSNPEVFTGYTSYVLDREDETKTIVHPKAMFTLNLNRSGLRHVFIMLLPLYLICAVGLIAIGSQNTIGGKALDINAAVTASIIAYRFVIETMSPKVSYLMVADHLYTYFLVFACAQLIYSKITYKQGEKVILILLRAALTFSFYLCFIYLWYFLVFEWSPAHKDVKIKPSTTKAFNERDEFYPDLELPVKEGQQIFQLGTSLDFNRIDRAFGRQIKNGINARLKKAYENNEMPNVSIQIDFKDDESYPIKTKENVKELLAMDINSFILPLGNETINSYLNLIKNKEVFVFFPVAGADFLREPSLTNVIHFRSSFAQEATLLTEYAIKEIGTHRIVFLYEDTAFGLTALDGARRVIEEHKDYSVGAVEISYEKHDIKFDKQIDELQKADPDTIIFFAPGTAVLEIIHQFGIENLIGKNLMGTSYLNQTFFHNLIEEKGLTFVTSNLVPDPMTSDIPLAREFREVAKSYEIAVGPFAFEAYIAMDLLMTTIKTMQGPVTPENIMRNLEQIKNYDYKGMILDFDPQTRELSTNLWLDTGKKKWRQVEKFQIDKKIEINNARK